MSSVRLIAFYLPQFHPTPENDKWWGKGFTEWTNVTKARPQFRGHYQPHLPSDLGFYDLRLPEVRQAQADLARTHGVDGFCYHHYWFGGTRMLEKPFEEVLESGKPDFPFCLSWANESWSRIWTSPHDASDVLLDQTYSREDDRCHIRYLISAFKDERYIRINDKPLFLIYRTDLVLHRLGEMLEIWNDELDKAGIDGLYLASVRTPPPAGFEASVDFIPGKGPYPERSRLENYFRYFLPRIAARFLTKHRVYKYGDIVELMLNLPSPEYKQFLCPVPGWDNTARRAERGALIFKDSTPALFEKWMRFCVRETEERFSGEERILFVNAWNEWAEGCHLEPDSRWGLQYLESLKRVLDPT